jgi:hypothetical protein
MIAAFLDWFDRHKLGIIGTLALHTLAMFLLLVTEVRTVPREDQRSDMRIDVIDDELAEEMIQEIEEREALEAGAPVSNVAKNIHADLVAPRWSDQRLAERVENDLRALERSEFERLAEERRERGEEDITIPELDPSKWDKNLYMDRAVEPVKVEGATTVWYDLDKPKRVDVYLKIPAYLCRGFGQVVINVQVDRTGSVRKATVDRGQSTTDDDCMVSSALASASAARFAPHAQAPDIQTGSIYYRFMKQ